MVDYSKGELVFSGDKDVYMANLESILKKNMVCLGAIEEDMQALKLVCKELVIGFT